MMPASKHGDPQVGVDIHLCVVPPSPSPVPLPTPHTSIVFDPFDYVPVLGATVTVCGMKRATAGTGGIAIHIPPGFPFAPKLPDKDDELFMGSSTVVADGDPFSYIALPVLSCQVAGMMSPFRPKKKGGPKAMVLPTVFNLAIPTSVFVGGAPTISLMGLAFKGAFAALGKFAKSGVFKRIRQKLFKNMKPGFLKCKVLRAEPVNILTGEVVVEHEDFTLSGRIPLRWERTYASGRSEQGACGYGWESPADIRLEVDPADGTVTMHHPTGPMFFAKLPQGGTAEIEPLDGARLRDGGTEYLVRTKEQRVYHFPRRPARTASGSEVFAIGRISDFCGNWLDFERRNGHLAAIVESSGRRLEIVSDGSRIVEIAMQVTPATRHVFVRYEQDAAGDLVNVVDALGRGYRYIYDSHHLTAHVNRRGLAFHYEYDRVPGPWRVVRAWGDGGILDYRFGYFDAVRERRITDSLGNVTVVILDDRELPIAEIDPLGGRTVFEYGETGRPSAVVDPDGHRTEFIYDGRGNLLELRSPDGSSILTAFDEDDRPTRVTDGNGSVWRQRWNDRGLLEEQESPLGHTSRFEYDEYGQMIAYVNAAGGRTQLAFDDTGNIASITDAAGRKTVYSWDPLGNLRARVDARGRRTEYRYDAKSRLTEVLLPSGARPSYTYDPADYLTSYIDENGAETRLEYWGMGHIARRTGPDGHSLRFEFDAEERLTVVVNQRGERYELIRDELGRIVEERDYWGQSRHYTYTAAGRLLESRDPVGRILRYESDPLGRVLLKTLHVDEAGPPTDVETFEYDGNGNLAACQNGEIRIERTFDAEGRLVEESQGGEFVLQNDFDEIGNRVRRVARITRGNVASEHVVRYAYDAAGHATAVEIDDAPAVRIERDAAGNIVAEDLGNGIRRARQYDEAGHLARQTASIGDDRILDIAYRYDAAGNLLERMDASSGRDRFTYDPVGRVMSHLDPLGTLHTYLADPAGDRLQTRVTRSRQAESGPLAGRLSSREAAFLGASYRFDVSGALVSRHDHRGELTLHWDANQRLIESRLGAAVTQYRYDPLGRRVGKLSATGVSRYYWDGDAYLGEARMPHRDAPAADLVRHCVYYPRSFEALALLEDSGGARELLHVHNDPNGAAVRVTGPDGRSRWSASYSALGKAQPDVAPAFANPLRMQGQYEDPETGLCYNRYRYFDPDAGQFISQDPIGLVGGTNVYGYGENVTRWTDPAGLSGVITNKFPDEELPTDGKILPHTVEDGKIKLDKPGAREFDFVVTTDNRLVIGSKHHLLGDRSDVLAAGRMKISGDGTLRRIDNLSGHYRPSPAEAEAFADALRKAGVNVKGATQEIFDFIVGADGLVHHKFKVKTCKL